MSHPNPYPNANANPILNFRNVVQQLQTSLSCVLSWSAPLVFILTSNAM